MMHRGWKRGATLIAVLGFACIPISAEVSVDIGENGFHIIILGVTEGPDPWGMIWEPHRDIEDERILNAYGSERGDGRPHVAAPDSNLNIVVWSYNSSGDHDIAFSEWTGIEWSEPLFLTDETTDDLDPRVLVTESGNVHVAWWVKQTKNLYITTRLGHSNVWRSFPYEVEAPLGGARPSMAEFEGKLHVTYESFSLTPGVTKDIVVARRTGPYSFEYVTVGQSTRTMANDSMMHVHDNVAWVDWKQTDDTFGYVIYLNGAWGDVQLVPWTDPSWVGEEDTRLAIQTLVLESLPDDDSPVEQLGARGHHVEPQENRFQLPYREQRELQ